MFLNLGTVPSCRAKTPAATASFVSSAHARKSRDTCRSRGGRELWRSALCRVYSDGSAYTFGRAQLGHGVHGVSAHTVGSAFDGISAK